MRHIQNCKVFVRKGGQDCTGKGITYRYDDVTVIVNVPYKYTEWQGKQYYDQPDEVAVRQYCHKKGLDEQRVLLLCDKRNNPIYSPYLKPLDAVWGVRRTEKLTGPCAGGNYVLVRDPDEQWKETMYRVHDRYDTQKVWDGLSI